MKRNRKRVFAAVLAVCALAAGGAAFTAGISSVPASAVAGFAQTQITGAQASSVVWNITSDGQYVQSVVMHLTSDGSTALPSSDVVQAGFDQTTTGSAGTATLTTCTEDTTDATKWTCTPTSDSVTVQDAHIFNVSVTDGTTAQVQ
jgi:hypothetical protein